MSDSLRPHGLCSPWNSPGQNTGVGSLSLLQGIFPRNQTRVSCIAGRFFTNWTMREVDWVTFTLGFPCGSTGKESACNAGDLGSTPGSGRSPGEGNGYPLQYSGLENSINCIVHRVTKSRTRLSDFYYGSWASIIFKASQNILVHSQG